MPLATSTMIRTAGAQDLPLLADVLARAFQDDPVFAWSIRDPADGRARLPALFETFAEVFLPHDETYLTDDRTSAAVSAPASVGAHPARGSPSGARNC